MYCVSLTALQSWLDDKEDIGHVKTTCATRPHWSKWKKNIEMNNQLNQARVETTVKTDVNVAM